MELRQFNEQEAKNELGRAIGVLTGIEIKIKENVHAHGQAADKRFEEMNSAHGPESIMAWDSYILRLEQESERLAEEAARAEQLVEEKRSLYIEANRELKVMEKLKEKREAEYRKESLAAETRQLDDLPKKS